MVFKVLKVQIAESIAFSFSLDLGTTHASAEGAERRAGKHVHPFLPFSRHYRIVLPIKVLGDSVLIKCLAQSDHEGHKNGPGLSPAAVDVKVWLVHAEVHVLAVVPGVRHCGGADVGVQRSMSRPSFVGWWGTLFVLAAVGGGGVGDRPMSVDRTAALDFPRMHLAIIFEQLSRTLLGVTSEGNSGIF